MGDGESGDGKGRNAKESLEGYKVVTNPYFPPRRCTREQAEEWPNNKWIDPYIRKEDGQIIPNPEFEKAEYEEIFLESDFKVKYK